MTTKFVVCIAGLATELFQHAQSISSKRFAPHGQLVLRKYPDTGYTKQLADEYIAEAARWVREQNESDRISFVLLYVNHFGQQTSDFVQQFFPFALPIPIQPIDLSATTTKNSVRAAYNKFIEGLVEAAVWGRRTANAVSHALKDEHKTPVLLPVRNFQSPDFRNLLEDVYVHLSDAEDIPRLIQSRFAEFERNNRCIHKTGGGKQKCFFDGELYFIGPGKNRHGYFRHRSKGHESNCILTAKSRLGGSFSHDFHYDCQPARGLRSSYANCHDAAQKPKPKHINIAPNDYVI